MPKEFTPRAILVIDDEPLIQWAVSEALSQAGHDVVTAYTRSVCVPVIIRGRERRRVRPVRLRDVFRLPSSRALPSRRRPHHVPQSRDRLGAKLGRASVGDLAASKTD